MTASTPADDAVDVALRVAAAIELVFGLGSTPYDEAEFARRRAVKVRASGEQLVLKSPEDTVLRKLLWYQSGGSVSERQWRDVVEVLRISGRAMDESYLDRWANQLGLSELLQKARSESLSE